MRWLIKQAGSYKIRGRDLAAEVLVTEAAPASQARLVTVRDPTTTERRNIREVVTAPHLLDLTTNPVPRRSIIDE